MNNVPRSAGRVVFFGLGAMGRRMAMRLVAAGYEVAVWNRSGVPAGADGLGSRACGAARAAVADANVVFSMVRDDEASRELWLDPRHGALASLRPGALLVECSTLSPTWILELGSHAQRAGVDFLEAPVVGSRPQAEAGALAFLIGGAPSVVERARPLLSSMGTALHHLGPTPSGACAKLFVNALFAVQVSAVAELLGLARKALPDVTPLVAALETLPVSSPAAMGALGGMVARRFAPMFPVDLVSKDVRYALELARSLGITLPMTERAQEILGEAILAGDGAANLTVVAKLYD